MAYSAPNAAQPTMKHSHDDGKEEPVTSKILDYYFAELDGDASNSIYSTYSPYSDTQYNDDTNDSYASRLQQSIRSLCNIGLRIASIRHDRSIAKEALSAAEDTVTKLGSELLMDRLDLDGAANADEISDMLITESLPARAAHIARIPPSPRVLGFQQAAGRARQLRVNMCQLDSRLENEERLILWPGLEQWRLAVAEHHRRRQFEALGERRDPHPVQQAGSDEDLDQLLCKIRNMLPRLGRHRLQHLRDDIGNALQYGTVSSECQESDVPIQTFF